MQINLDSGSGFVITAYNDDGIQINDGIYSDNILITPNKLHTQWPANALNTLTIDHLLPHIDSSTELVLIGQKTFNHTPSMSLIEALSKRRIGFEFMALGAACRTYSVLNSENRQFIAGFIF